MVEITGRLSKGKKNYLRDILKKDGLQACLEKTNDKPEGILICNGWEYKYDDRENVFLNNDGTTLLYRPGYKQGGGSEWYVATDYDILDTFETKQEAYGYAFKYMIGDIK